MSHRVSTHLRLDVAEYDSAIRRFIPGYDRMLGRAARQVVRASPGRVLDLGAGTGALADAFLARSNVGTVVLTDVDEEMLERARARLTPVQGRFEAHFTSFFDPLPVADAVMASLSLHHIPEMGDKEVLYRRIFELLPSGGLFVNADVMVAERDPERFATFRAWADHLVACGIEEEEAWRHFEDWAEEDTYFPLAAEIEALRRCGFRARCVWRDEPSTVVVAMKP